jgi:hypothetical protein
MPWNSDIAFNFRDMAYEFARYNRVLFVDRAGDRKSFLISFLSGRHSTSDKRKDLEQVQDNFWVLHPKSMLNPPTGRLPTGYLILTGSTTNGWHRR